MRKIVLVSCLLLGACASGGNDIVAAEVALTAAEKAATLYTKLPRCAGANSSICSEQGAVDKIKALDNTAYGAVKAAEANPALVSIAVSAVSDLNNAIPKGAN
jgi:hypothetical protein